MTDTAIAKLNDMVGHVFNRLIVCYHNNGISVFFIYILNKLQYFLWCAVIQCARWTCSISTIQKTLEDFFLLGFSYSFTSTHHLWSNSVNALYRASFISTARRKGEDMLILFVSMPFIGLSSFLPCHSEPHYLCGFPAPFLQVIIWIFWKLAFFTPFSSRLQFRHILFYLFDFVSYISSILLFWFYEKHFLKILFPTTQQEIPCYLKTEDFLLLNFSELPIV